MLRTLRFVREASNVLLLGSPGVGKTHLAVALAEPAIQSGQAAEGGPGKRITAEAEQFLQTLDWPGNIRQLEHSVQMAVALSDDRNLLISDDFKTRVSAHDLHPDRRARASVIPQGGIDWRK